MIQPKAALKCGTCKKKVDSTVFRTIPGHMRVQYTTHEWKTTADVVNATKQLGRNIGSFFFLNGK